MYSNNLESYIHDYRTNRVIIEVHVCHTQIQTIHLFVYPFLELYQRALFISNLRHAPILSLCKDKDLFPKETF